MIPCGIRWSIFNTGNAAATGVVFDDTADPNSPLVTGSVGITQGVVTSGNGAGQMTVAVAVGTVAASGSALIAFLVDITDPAPAGVTQVSNQGRVSSNELPVVVTDDPSRAGSGNPTVTSIVADPVLSASKSATLLDGCRW